MPRISFRTMLIASVLGALLAATARAAGNGVLVFKAVLASLIVVATFFGLAAIAFLIAWVVARLVHRQAKDYLEGNPFADGNLPPQQIRPRDPGDG
ncbi:MAG: hypothetical protein AAF745_10670 [Planctomycetota bacterium]